jgi:YVTN family beta-propeller protein
MLRSGFSTFLARGWRLATMSALLLAGTSAYALAYSPVAGAQTAASKAYVGLFKDNAVAVLDTASNQVLSTIPVPAGPHGAVITPDGRWVYVSSDGASTVSVIDTIPIGNAPRKIAVQPTASVPIPAAMDQ